MGQSLFGVLSSPRIARLSARDVGFHGPAYCRRSYRGSGGLLRGVALFGPCKRGPLRLVEGQNADAISRCTRIIVGNAQGFRLVACVPNIAPGAPGAGAPASRPVVAKVDRKGAGPRKPEVGPLTRRERLAGGAVVQPGFGSLAGHAPLGCRVLGGTAAACCGEVLHRPTPGEPQRCPGADPAREWR